MPARSIGGGETLLDLQWVNLFDDWQAGISKIASVTCANEISSLKKEIDNCDRLQHRAVGGNSFKADGWRARKEAKILELFEKYKVKYRPE